MQSPEDKILKRMKTVLAAAPIHTALVLADPVNVRHERNRNSTREERPCVAIRFVSTEPDRERGFHSTDELCWRMSVDLVIDLKLATEDSNDDETGINQLTVAAGACMKALLDPAGAMMSYIDDVEDEGTGNDEDSSEDEGRLVQKISVLYRTPQGDRNVLLSPEENL